MDTYSLLTALTAFRQLIAFALPAAARHARWLDGLQAVGEHHAAALHQVLALREKLQLGHAVVQLVVLDVVRHQLQRHGVHRALGSAKQQRHRLVRVLPLLLLVAALGLHLVGLVADGGVALFQARELTLELPRQDGRAVRGLAEHREAAKVHVVALEEAVHLAQVHPLVVLQPRVTFRLIFRGRGGGFCVRTYFCFDGFSFIWIVTERVTQYIQSFTGA